MKTVVYTDRATKQLDALPPAAQRQVVDAIEGYATHGRGDIKKLTGRSGCRLRAGSYRVIFDEDQMIILAIEITRRTTTTYR